MLDLVPTELDQIKLEISQKVADNHGKVLAKAFDLYDRKDCSNCKFPQNWQTVLGWRACRAVQSRLCANLRKATDILDCSEGSGLREIYQSFPEHQNIQTAAKAYYSYSQCVERSILHRHCVSLSVEKSHIRRNLDIWYPEIIKAYEHLRSLVTAKFWSNDAHTKSYADILVNNDLNVLKISFYEYVLPMYILRRVRGGHASASLFDELIQLLEVWKFDLKSRKANNLTIFPCAGCVSSYNPMKRYFFAGEFVRLRSIAD